MMTSMRKLNSLGPSTISKYRPALWIQFFTEGHGRSVPAQAGGLFHREKSDFRFTCDKNLVFGASGALGT